MRKVESILEIGCGTGTFTRLLTDIFPEAHITALDFSPPMLEVARQKLGDTKQVTFLCKEAEKFLEQAGDGKENFDLVTSTGALQWFADLGRAIGHMQKLLRPGGLLSFAIFGPRTMEELQRGLEEVLGKKGLLPAGGFVAPEALQELLRTYGPAARVEEKCIVWEYSSVLHLLRHIRHTGTSGWQDAAPPLLNRSRIARLEEWFQNRYGACRITYQILLVEAEK